MSSITERTLKQYNTGLKLWWEFCQTRKRDPFSVEVSNVLEFLTHQFYRGVSYSSLNSYRAAIAQIAGPDLSQDYRLQRFFKGVYMLRPSSPKYGNTWDPAIVLNHLRNKCNSDVSLEILTQKCVTLLALASGQRLQTLSLIDIRNIHHIDNRIDIHISARIKTSGRNRLQPSLQLPYFEKDPNLCVARTLLAYLKRTEAIRGSITSLFLTIRKPYKKASTQTLGRWVKDILAKSGIDTKKFTAHSTRHAATSAAARKGLNFDTIRLAAGWSKNSKMFAEVYNRPLVVENETFAETILSL
ncbi:unnamed protein product [Callosobruchus maculatus]|uniref:Tyr recombinase domain-containing protein n=1 Tax=Callosobruchus maculatus TaxID=64391 RepID=A0A653BKA7_CALMS|nr:unnamed protein product [Callosobruchus maculatus]